MVGTNSRMEHSNKPRAFKVSSTHTFLTMGQNCPQLQGGPTIHRQEKESMTGVRDSGNKKQGQTEKSQEDQWLFTT